MNNNLKYKFVGYTEMDSLDPKVFSWAVSVFMLDKQLYRFYAENGIVTKFLSVSGEYIAFESDRFCKIGEEALFVYRYENEVHLGTLKELEPKLRELLKRSDEEFSPLLKYDVSFFLNDKEMVDDSINRIINFKDYSSLNLTPKNFLRL